MPKPAALNFTFLTVLLIALAGQGCASATQSAVGDVDSLAKAKLGANFSVTYNDSGQFALCQQTSSANDHAFRKFKFIVVNVSNNTITHEGSFQNGYAKWIESRSVEVSSSTKDEKREVKIIPINDQQS